MGGLLAGLTTVLQAIATAFTGQFGVLLATVGLGGTAMAVLLFHAPMSWLWKAVIVIVIMLGCGQIAQALTGV